MSEQTLRDKFAAAALTGLIERRPWPVDKNESATICYQFADAMLRERARNGAVEGREMVTDHDAAPAAKAEVATGTGHTTREPVAWAAIDGYGRVVFTAPSAAACPHCNGEGKLGPIVESKSQATTDEIIRLSAEVERLLAVIDRAGSHWIHLHPGVAWEGDLGDAMAAAVAEIASLREEVAKLRMTDSEREAMETFAFDRPMDRATAAQTAATLRSLLARLGGGE